MMRNKILSVTRNVVPYVKGLRSLPLIKSVVACILMQQLDYWFKDYPQGFYKFLEQPATNHRAYKVGDSWTEELGISADEFRTAFDQIGIRYKSKKEYDAAEDKFQGKYYCSYTDKLARLTHYFRNHEVVDAALDTLSALGGSNGNLYNPAMPASRNGHGQAIGAVSPKPHITETTTETTQKITSREERGADAPTHSLQGDTNDDVKQERDLKGNRNDSEKKAPSRFKPLKVSTDNFEFEITPEMREWLVKNCRHDFDLEMVTEKFIYNYDENQKKLTPGNWKVWMLREDKYEDEHCNGCDGCCGNDEKEKDNVGADTHPAGVCANPVEENETAFAITKEMEEWVKSSYPLINIEVATKRFIEENPNNLTVENWISWMQFVWSYRENKEEITTENWLNWKRQEQEEIPF